MPPDISVIIPTLNEAENLSLLIPQVAEALAGRSYEILLIDDASRDGTAEVCARLAERYPLTLRVRPAPIDGLSGAVMEGFSLSRGRLIAVMDADLQHPPEKLPDLLDALDGGAEFALGTRYATGGSLARQWGPARRLNSRLATLLAKPFSGGASDPMSGFFALRRDVLARAEFLSPMGYKIGLELMCKCRSDPAVPLRVAEVPIHFGARRRGASKLSVYQQFRYLEHLSRLYDFRYPRLSPVLKFAVVTLIGWFVGLGLFLIERAAGLPVWAAAGVGYGGAVAAEWVFHARYVRAQRPFLVGGNPWARQAACSALEWLTAAAAAWYVGSRLSGASAGEVFLAAFAAGAVVRYVVRKELLLDVRGLRHHPRVEAVKR